LQISKAYILKPIDREMSAEEEEPIIPKSRRVNDAIAPKRLNQVLFLNKKEIKTKTIFQTS